MGFIDKGVVDFVFGRVGIGMGYNLVIKCYGELGMIRVYLKFCDFVLMEFNYSEVWKGMWCLLKWII